MNYICSTCGKPMTPATMHTKRTCLDCRREYMAKYRKANRERYNDRMREYMRGCRWLAGGERIDDLGPRITVGLRSVGGVLRVIA